MSKGPPKGIASLDDDFTDLTMLLLTFFVLLVATSKARCSKIVKDA